MFPYKDSVAHAYTSKKEYCCTFINLKLDKVALSCTPKRILRQILHVLHQGYFGTYMYLNKDIVAFACTSKGIL